MIQTTKLFNSRRYLMTEEKIKYYKELLLKEKASMAQYPL